MGSNNRIGRIAAWTAGGGALLLALAVQRVGTTGEPLSGLLAHAFLGAAAGAAGGTLASILVARTGAARSLPFSLIAGVARTAPAGAFAGCLVAMLSQHPGEMARAIVAGSMFGGTLGLVLAGADTAGYAFRLAVIRARNGDRAGARHAIRIFLKYAKPDEGHDQRVPVARRFLAEEDALLEIPTEPIAADPPAGRGTEPEPAPAPAGRGSELESGPDPEAPAGPRAVPARDRRR